MRDHHSRPTTSRAKRNLDNVCRATVEAVEPRRLMSYTPVGGDSMVLYVNGQLVCQSSVHDNKVEVIPVKVEAFIPMQDDGLAVDVAFVPAGSASEQQAPGQATGQTGRSHGVGRLGGDGLAFASSPGTVNTWVSVLANH